MRRLLIPVLALFMLLTGPLAVMAQDATPVPEARDEPVAGGGQVPVGTVVPLISAEGTEVGTMSVDSIVEPFEDYEGFSPPLRGYHYALLNITVTNTGARTLEGDPYDFYVVDTDGIVISTVFISRLADSLAAVPDFVYTENIARGTSVTGAVVYQVYNDAPIERVFYSPDSTRNVTLVDQRTAPAALGNPVSFKAIDGQEVGTVQIDFIADPYLNADPNSPPPAGTRYIQVGVTISNTSDRTFYADGYGVTLVDSEGFVAQQAFVSRTDQATAPDFPSSDLAPGSLISGVLHFSMLEGVTPVRALYALTFQNQVVAADITAEDIAAGGSMNTGGTTGTGTTTTTGGDPAVCIPVVGWAGAVTATLNLAMGADSFDAAIATPEDLLARAASVAAAAAAVESLDTPEAAQAYSDALLIYLDDMGSLLEQLSEARESGDTAADSALLAELNTHVDQIFAEDSEITLLGNELATTCPELNEL